MSTIVLACTRIFFIPIEEETTRTHDLSIKGNNMKNKKMAVAGISLLGSIGVISTGFAGWIIAAAPVSNHGTGTITADGNVTSKSVSLVEAECKFDDAGANIYYGPNKASVNGGWLTATVDQTPKLTATYTLKFNYSGVKTITIYDIKIEEVIASGDSSKYQPLLTAEYVDALPALTNKATANRSAITAKVTGVTDDKVTYGDKQISYDVIKAETTSTSTVTFKIEFAWGKAFGYENPMDFYNKGSYTADAETALAAFKNFSASYKFSYTVSAN